MRLVLVADTFPPLRTSGAVQLRDLAREFAAQGHELTVLLPAADLPTPFAIGDFDGARVVRLKAPRTKDIGYVRRTLGELAMPFAMRHNLAKSPLAAARFDGVIWYSPSIFHGPLVRWLKQRSDCPAYLILRDIFPQWAADMGLMGRGAPYRFFATVARYQYAQADVIGVQTHGNLHYFHGWQQRHPQRQLEILENWLGAPARRHARIRIADTRLAGRQILVYAGNMGVAQGLDIILDLARLLHTRRDIGFVMVGRGSEAARLREAAQPLDNMLFFDEIDPDEIPDLYAQCAAGIVALDHRHTSHNIPGKFLTYLQSGLPVLATVNPGNDLVDLIRRERVGAVSDGNRATDLLHQTHELLQTVARDPAIAERCRHLFQAHYSAAATVRQIVRALRRDRSPAARPR